MHIGEKYINLNSDKMIDATIVTQSLDNLTTGFSPARANDITVAGRSFNDIYFVDKSVDENGLMAATLAAKIQNNDEKFYGPTLSCGFRENSIKIGDINETLDPYIRVSPAK